MAKRPPLPPDSGDLLNLPLGREEPAAAFGAQDLLPFEGADEREPRAEPTPSSPPPAGQERGGGRRLKAGFLDIAAVGGASILAFLGALILGAHPSFADLPAFLLFVLAFSFLYTVVPLTFWGQTPGMAVTGLVARGPDSPSLTIGQSIGRWLAGVATVALVGLPALLALSGHSFSDRLSNSRLEPR